MNWFCSKAEEKGAAITQSYSYKNDTSEKSTVPNESEKFYTWKVFPYLTIFPRIMQVQNYNEEDLGFGYFLWLHYF